MTNRHEGHRLQYVYTGCAVSYDVIVDVAENRVTDNPDQPDPEIDLGESGSMLWCVTCERAVRPDAVGLTDDWTYE
jgi:hypothetical protein